MSRRRRRAVFVICFVLALGGVWLDRQHGSGLREVLLQKNPEGPDADKYHLKSFKVVNVVDGDTLDIDIPDGKYDHTRIRLLGIDTPETKSPKYGSMYFGPQASQFAEKLTINKHATVIIDTTSPSRDRYRRLLGYLKLEDGEILNEELLRYGFAYADLRFKHSEFDKYVKLQDAAINSGIGLWKEAKKSDLPKWLQRERPDILKP